LLFADDSLLFFKLDGDQARYVKELLATFESATGQLLSPAKCSILLREGADPDLVNEVMMLNVERADFEAKYLLQPMPDGPMTRGDFKSIEEWYAKRMLGWYERLMSQAAKELLIKSVAQALPTYMMSVFKLPFGLCDALEKQERSFWWGTNVGKHKTQWIPWEVMVKPKNYGGLGFKDMRLFNQALLASQAMHLIDYPDSLCSQVLKAKYFP
jgi:hypothetical protein